MRKDQKEIIKFICFKGKIQLDHTKKWKTAEL